MVKSMKTTVTVEFPLTDELIDMDKQYVFELIRQKISEAMMVNSNDVWIKSISATTNFEPLDDLGAEA